MRFLLVSALAALFASARAPQKVLVTAPPAYADPNAPPAYAPPPATVAAGAVVGGEKSTNPFA